MDNASDLDLATLDPREPIDAVQEWNGRAFTFEVDSSPLAWKFHILMAADSPFLQEYDTEHLTGIKFDDSGCVQEADLEKCREKRLFATHRTIFEDRAWYRLSGDTCFNFNEWKVEQFAKVVDEDQCLSPERRAFLRKKLDGCADMHHSCTNLALMQSYGNLQGVKGGYRLPGETPGKYGFDRLDTFLYNLHDYYGLSEEDNRWNAEILKSARCIPGRAIERRPQLMGFLSQFNDIYDYAEQVYQIDRELTDALIVNGAIPINDGESLERYMDLAEKFWDARCKAFERKLAEGFMTK